MSFAFYIMVFYIMVFTNRLTFKSTVNYIKYTYLIISCNLNITVIWFNEQDTPCSLV